MGSKAEKNSRKVVCIDNDPMIIELLEIILNKHGFESFGAENGPTGLELIASEKPDLVLLDIMMTGMDGWEVYQHMRHDDAMRSIPVIVVTCKAQPIDKILALNIAKVNDYIVKPFTPGLLIDSINQVLGISGATAN